MSDDVPDSAPAPADEPFADPDVALVMPAPAYEAVDTEFEPVPAIVATTEDIGALAPEVPAARDDSEAFRALGERVEKGFDELKALFQREIRAEATREKVVDRLHAELQEYKQDLLLNTLRPVFIDLIQLHDDIGKVAIRPDGEAHPEVSRLVGLMEGFQQGIEDILYRQGVEPFESEGESFDPRRQRAIATVVTDDPTRARTIAARIRKGFRSGDRVIRPEIVSVHALKPAK